MPVGTTAMPVESIVKNVLAASLQLGEKIPGGAANIRNLHLKTPSSIAVPIYMSLGETIPSSIAHIPIRSCSHHLELGQMVSILKYRGIVIKLVKYALIKFCMQELF